MKSLITAVCALVALALGGCAGGGNAPVAAGECAGLKGQQLGQRQATITEATLVPEAAGVPEHCHVKVSLNDSTLRFESRLPARGWNGKMVALGGGGFKGAVFPPTLPFFSPSIIGERYATMATNGGYDNPVRDAVYYQANFAYDPVKLADYTYLSIHRSYPLGRELVQRFYGQAASGNYFEGCSAGGHEAMMLSQRFPGDFDGIVARAPAGNFMGLFLQLNHVAKALRSPGGMLNTAKQNLLARAVLDKCDAADGIADGVVSRPAACAFDPVALRCPNGADSGDACLSDAQIGTVKAALNGFATADGLWSHPGFYPGGENDAGKGWGEYVWQRGEAPFSGTSVQALFSDGFVRSFITRNPKTDTLKWNRDESLSSLHLMGTQFNAFNPDLSAFRARGGRLILWNGGQDTAVSPKDTTRYYGEVVKKMGQAAADETVELFIAPGVGHCFGGAGVDRVDLMKALVGWVERGEAPSRQGVLQSKLDAAGKVVATRPMCRHPAYPRYKGSGDPAQAASYACSTD
jgi:feruloyl esterase